MTDTGPVTDFLTDKRKYVLWLQWPLVVAIAYLLYFSGSTTPPILWSVCLCGEILPRVFVVKSAWPYLV